MTWGPSPVISSSRPASSPWRRVRMRFSLGTMIFRKLADDDHRMLSCLQLGFYLASWGMMRGSGDLLQRSVRDLVPVIEMIAAEPASTWDFDAHCLGTRTGEVLALSRRLRRAFSITVRDPSSRRPCLASSAAFRPSTATSAWASAVRSFAHTPLVRIGNFYVDHQAKVDARKVFTLDFDSGLDTKRATPEPRSSTSFLPGAMGDAKSG
jgi:hypothetical protein